MTTSRTSELEAINKMLRVIGESPVNSLATLPDDAISAKTVLRDVTREVLTKGWYWNTDEDFPLAADVVAPFEILIPAGAVKVDYNRTSFNDVDLVIRGNPPKLYDRLNHTFSFEGKIFKCTIVWLFPFEECPEELRQYITIKAARQFSDADLQSQIIHGITDEDMARAMAAWEAADLRQTDANMLRDNIDTGSIMVRDAGYGYPIR